MEGHMMDDARARMTGRFALATGAVAAGSIACLATYFVVGGPLGTINDLGNAATGVLSACLAWRLRRQIAGTAADVATGAALVGAAITVVGSGLVVSGTTGFVLAGLVSSVGFAGIGAWLVVANQRIGRPAGWPRSLRAIGIAAGSLMAFGVVTAPGILLGIDDMATAPSWIYVGYLGWLGTYVAYPAWGLWLGTRELRRARQSSQRAEEPESSRGTPLGKPTSEVP
jgi:hypothetical protein